MSRPLRSFSKRGPHPVGLRGIEIEDPHRADRRLPVDIWYPAAQPAESVEAEHDADHPFGFEHKAYVEWAAAPGRHPLVVFSHGNSGLNRQSTFLTTHLASWGFVVAAPDHAGNTFFEMMRIEDEETRRRAHFDARRSRPGDLRAVIDAVLTQRGGWAEVDSERIGACGHSYGGWTSIKMPGCDSRVRAVCGLAPVSEPFVGRKAFEPSELPFDPPLPILLIAAIDDVLVDLETSVRPLFERMAPPRALVGIDTSDHFHFCDGIEVLHELHVNNPRPNQKRPTRPFVELLGEARMQTLVCALVTTFFDAALGKGTFDPDALFSAASLQEFDPTLDRLD